MITEEGKEEDEEEEAGKDIGETTLAGRRWAPRRFSPSPVNVQLKPGVDLSERGEPLGLLPLLGSSRGHFLQPE